MKREREREKRGSCYSKSLGPADLENSSVPIMIRYSPREIGEKEGRNFQVAAPVSRNVIRGNVEEENGEQRRRRG